MHKVVLPDCRGPVTEITDHCLERRNSSSFNFLLYMLLCYNRTILKLYFKFGQKYKNFQNCKFFSLYNRKNPPSCISKTLSLPPTFSALARTAEMRSEIILIPPKAPKNAINLLNRSYSTRILTIFARFLTEDPKAPELVEGPTNHRRCFDKLSNLQHFND